jgi:TonB family protein
MTAARLPKHRPAALPWVGVESDERRFRRIQRRVLLTTAIIGLLLPWLPVPKIDRTQVEELPAPMARLLLDNKPMPMIPAPVKPAPKLEPDQKELAPRADDVKLDPKKAPVPEARRPEPNKPPGELLDNARRKASGVGLLAMKNDIADLRSAPAAVQLKADIKPGPGVGTGKGPGVGAGTDPGIPVRAMITSNATNGSGGINTAGYSRDTGGGGLAGRATTLVEGVAGGGGGGGYGGGGGFRGGGGRGTGTGAGGMLQRSGSGKASRSIEEIKLVFERNKGAIYAIYNRALREDPTLQGKVVLELTIAPSGNITNLRILSSELKAQELEQKLLARIRQFEFGSKDVEVMVVSWPVDFLPS